MRSNRLHLRRAERRGNERGQQKGCRSSGERPTESGCFREPANQVGRDETGHAAVEMLVPVRLTLLADRRRFQPYGLKGGEESAAGAAWVRRAGSNEETAPPGKCSRKLGPGDTVRIETPGGGWGRRSE